MAKINRSAESGKIVTKDYAKKNPGTTVTETVKNNKRVKAKIQNALNIINNQVVLIEGWAKNL
jgi:hypothetical protein